MTLSLRHPQAELFVPDRTPLPEALARTTHLGIGAHQDDLEFFAYHGIEACYGRDDRWFTGVTCTNGAGSSRTGPYAHLSDSEMAVLRAEEQRKAAVAGGYAAMAQLGYPSHDLQTPPPKTEPDSGSVGDLKDLLEIARPEFVYLHNPADKHDTHIAVLLRSLEALRSLPPEHRPKQAWGCEVWRGLDWLPDEDKQLLSTSARPHLQAALNGLFDSQIAGGKRYDLAVMGRRLANATFFESHAADRETGITWAMDLTPLVRDETLDVVAYTTGYLARLQTEVEGRLRKFL